jgi:hypothetical protein
MGWFKSALNVFRKSGPTVRFASKLVLGTVLPGSPAIINWSPRA